LPGPRRDPCAPSSSCAGSARPHIPNRYELEIVDIYQQPDLAERDGILAAPTLLKVAPSPERRISGDLLDEERLLRVLEIDPAMEAR
jgi:circadian clock protein KaiB